MNNIIPLKEFRTDVAKFAERAKKGDSFIITKRSRPLFRVGPVDESGWETVIDFTKFRKNGISAGELLKILESM